MWTITAYVAHDHPRTRQKLLKVVRSARRAIDVLAQRD
jgi:hypothetical protein